MTPHLYPARRSSGGESASDFSMSGHRTHGLTHAQWILMTTLLAIILAVIPRSALG